MTVESNQSHLDIGSVLDRFVEARSEFNTSHDELVRALGGLVGKTVSMSGYPNAIGVSLYDPALPENMPSLNDMSQYSSAKPNKDRKLFVLPANTVLAATSRSIVVESLTLEPEAFMPPRQYRFTLKNIIAIAELQTLPETLEDK